MRHRAWRRAHHNPVVRIAKTWSRQSGVPVVSAQVKLCAFGLLLIAIFLAARSNGTMSLDEVIPGPDTDERELPAGRGGCGGRL
jgi:hypothetical protein